MTEWLNLDKVKLSAVENSIKEIIARASDEDSHIQFTPLALCQELVQKIIDAGIVPGKNWLVIANLELLYVARAWFVFNGWSLDNLHYAGASDRKLNFAKRLLGNENTHKYEYDKIKEWNLPMKFDVILGNPPYQRSIQRIEKERKGSGSGNRIWHLFVEKAFNHLKDSGFLGFITPHQWRLPSLKENDNLKITKDLLTSNNMIWLMINVDTFFNIGNSIQVDAYVCQKGEYMLTTEIVNSKNNFVDRINLQTFIIPTNLDNVSKKSISTLISIQEEKIKIEITPRRFASNNSFIVEEKLENHNFEFLNTSAQYLKGKRLWSSIAHPFQFNKKIMFSDSGEEGFIFDNEGKYGGCHHTHCILVNNDIEGYALLEFLRSEPVIKFLNFFRKEGSMYSPTYAISLLPKVTSHLSNDKIKLLMGQ